MRSATTGSFFAALLEGINPESNVKPILIKTRMTAPPNGNIARKVESPVSACKIKLMGIHKRYVTSTPKSPDANPMISVSALNILDTSRFDAPIARKIPISFVRSCTDMSVITPIIIDDTTRDMDTNAINTYVIASIMVVMDDINNPI